MTNEKIYILYVITNKEYMQITDYNTNTKKEVNYEKGLVIKIQDFQDTGRDYHNHWGVILGMYDNTTYRVAIEIADNSTDIVGIEIHNIKRIVGDIDSDFCDIGKKRHSEEVVPLIIKMINL